jgi:thiopurine S-methyltransferase
VNNQTGWDIGYISTPLKIYFDQIKNKEISIFIPGAGNAYEAEYLFNTGFTNVYVMDIAAQPLLNLKSRIPDIEDKFLLQDDFFSHKGSYDLIIEQTFFCSLDPGLRSNYALKISELLKLKGKLIGVLFNTSFDHEGPPFGGYIEEYQKIFSEFFNIRTLSTCYNSILPRQEQEVFINFEKKK